MPSAKIVNRESDPPEKISKNPSSAPPCFLQKLGEGLAVDPGRGNMRPDPIYHQHPHGKEDTGTQLGDFENILKTGQESLKHRG